MMKKFLITILVLCCAACNSDWRKQYDEVAPTRTENMKVRKGDKYGLVNPKGLEITPVKYDYIDTNPPQDMPFYDVTINNLRGIIKPSGEEIIPAEYDFIWYSQGVFVVKLNDSYQLLDSHNKSLTPWFDEIDVFYQGLAFAKNIGYYGFLNPKGELVLPFVYDDADHFNESGYAMVKYKGKWGMIDKKGNTKLPFEYEHAEPYSEPTEEWEDYYYMLIKNGKELTIDKKGNFL